HEPDRPGCRGEAQGCPPQKAAPCPVRLMTLLIRPGHGRCSPGRLPADPEPSTNFPGLGPPPGITADRAATRSRIPPPFLRRAARAAGAARQARRLLLHPRLLRPRTKTATAGNLL